LLVAPLTITWRASSGKQATPEICSGITTNHHRGSLPTPPMSNFIRAEIKDLFAPKYDPCFACIGNHLHPPRLIHHRDDGTPVGVRA
jgi:hypothetical protein